MTTSPVSIAGLLEGFVWLAASGQWRWEVREEGSALCGGAGYTTEDDARDDMLNAFSDYSARG